MEAYNGRLVQHMFLIKRDALFSWLTTHLIYCHHLQCMIIWTKLCPNYHVLELNINYLLKKEMNYSFISPSAPIEIFFPGCDVQLRYIPPFTFLGKKFLTKRCWLSCDYENKSLAWTVKYFQYLLKLLSKLVVFYWILTSRGFSDGNLVVFRLS